MKRRTSLTLLAILAIVLANAVVERFRPRWEDRAGAVEHAYGPAARERLDLYPGAPGARRPLMLWLHGGGWSAGDKGDGGGAKPAHFAVAGFAWGSIGYRLVPDARVEDQLASVARALAWLRANAARLRIDPDRILLVGHSSGAHLAAMLGSDTRWLDRAGVPVASIRGIVLIDSASLDVPQLMRSGLPGIFPLHDAAFGEDVARQRRLSPVTHAAAPNVRDWLILYDAGGGGKGQADGFGGALAAHGSRVRVAGIGGSDHARMAGDLGTPGEATTRVLTEWARAKVQ